MIWKLFLSWNWNAFFIFRFILMKTYDLFFFYRSARILFSCNFSFFRYIFVFFIHFSVAFVFMYRFMYVLFCCIVLYFLALVLVFSYVIFYLFYFLRDWWIIFSHDLVVEAQVSFTLVLDLAGMVLFQANVFTELIKLFIGDEIRLTLWTLRTVFVAKFSSETPVSG